MRRDFIDDYYKAKLRTPKCELAGKTVGLIGCGNIGSRVANMSIGNRVYRKRETASPGLVERFKKIPAANVADCMGRLFASNSGVYIHGIFFLDKYHITTYY